MVFVLDDCIVQSESTPRSATTSSLRSSMLFDGVAEDESQSL